MHLKKQRQYNLILTTVAFLMLIITIIIAVSLNKRQQTFYSEAQNFAKHVALYIPQDPVTPGHVVQVMVYAEKPSDKDWIGLFSLQGSADQPISKLMLSECVLRPSGEAQVGFCDFSVPDAAGGYVFRLYRDTLFMTATVPLTVIAASGTVAIPSPSSCTPQLPCLHQTPACVIATPVNGWCPVSD